MKLWRAERAHQPADLLNEREHPFLHEILTTGIRLGGGE